MVGAEGFEPTTPASQTLCATGLRYAPTTCESYRQAGEFVKRARCAQVARLAAAVYTTGTRRLATPYDAVREGGENCEPNCLRRVVWHTGSRDTTTL
jgi:hypothetical protein